MQQMAGKKVCYNLQVDSLPSNAVLSVDILAVWHSLLRQVQVSFKMTLYCIFSLPVKLVADITDS
jgi:hypothetical protein